MKGFWLSIIGYACCYSGGALVASGIVAWGALDTLVGAILVVALGGLVDNK